MKIPAEIEPHHLDGIAALVAARSTPLKKLKDEKDTAFVKRIVCAYLNAHTMGEALLSNT